MKSHIWNWSTVKSHVWHKPTLKSHISDNQLSGLTFELLSKLKNTRPVSTGEACAMSYTSTIYWLLYGALHTHSLIQWMNLVAHAIRITYYTVTPLCSGLHRTRRSCGKFEIVQSAVAAFRALVPCYPMLMFGPSPWFVSSLRPSLGWCVRNLQ